MEKKVSQRQELLYRIVTAIVTGIILSVWKFLIFILALVNLVIVLFTNKKDKGVADFCDYFNVELYRYCRYITFASDERPFPLSDLKHKGIARETKEKSSAKPNQK